MKILNNAFKSFGCVGAVLAAPGMVRCQSGAKRVAANHPDINYMGRIHWTEDGQGAFTYPGTTAMFRFQGTGVGMETSPGSCKFIVEIDAKEPLAVTYTPTDSLLTLA